MSLENVTHDEAVLALKSTGERVRLLIAKTSSKVAGDMQQSSYTGRWKLCTASTAHLAAFLSHKTYTNQ